MKKLEEGSIYIEPQFAEKKTIKSQLKFQQKKIKLVLSKYLQLVFTNGCIYQILEKHPLCRSCQYDLCYDNNSLYVMALYSEYLQAHHRDIIKRRPKIFLGISVKWVCGFSELGTVSDWALDKCKKMGKVENHSRLED